MSITELINKLEQVRAEHGDIEAITYDYAGGDYEERDPLCGVKNDFNYHAAPVLVINA